VQEAGISRAVGVAAGVMPSEEVPEGTTERAHAPAAAAALPAWDLVVVVAAEAVDGAGKRDANGNHRSTEMKSKSANANLSRSAWMLGAVAWVCLSAPVFLAAQQAPAAKVQAAGTAGVEGARGFDTPQQAADALVDAAGKFDEEGLMQIFGTDGDDVIFTGEIAQDRQRAFDFAAMAKEKNSISVDSRSRNRAFLLVGDENWPFPVPLVKRGDKWYFDSKAGRQELLYRRVGANELDAIQICHGYVEAQQEYAFRKREGYDVNQYAQRIISTPGKQDGLAWQNADGTWGGPIGEKIALAIQQGYSNKVEPYHGYVFKVLKGQGPAAPLGEMDYVVEGVMIGGFALVATPAEYGVTGVKTFMVSNDGVVYQRDFGIASFDNFTTMKRFNPDSSWSPIVEEND
jgi:hypothetical protein